MKMTGGGVVLIGADGCGKSTIADLLLRQLRKRGISVMHQHWRPMLLPSPRIIVGQKATCYATQPHKNEPHTEFVSLFLSAYYWADFWIGHFFRVLPFIRKGGILIRERYIYDMLFDPIRHRLNAPEGWVSLLCKLAPNPGLIVFLGGDPQKLYERKGELSPREIERQQNLIAQYLRCHFETIWICTTEKSPREASVQIKARMISLGIC